MTLTVVLSPLQNRGMERGGRSTNQRASYDTVAEKAGDIWFISVPNVPGALAATRRHDQIEAIARVVIAQALQVPHDSFDVDIRTRAVRPAARVGSARVTP
jgi:hypothetical protein